MNQQILILRLTVGLQGDVQPHMARLGYSPTLSLLNQMLGGGNRPISPAPITHGLTH